MSELDDCVKQIQTLLPKGCLVVLVGSHTDARVFANFYDVTAAEVGLFYGTAIRVISSATAGARMNVINDTGDDANGDLFDAGVMVARSCAASSDSSHLGVTEEE